MPINKFGTSLGKNGVEPYYQWSGLLRNFVRENALCMGAADFDAKSRKIKRVALPVDDGDVANKRYVLQSMKILKDQQDEIDKKLAALQNNMQIMINELQKIQQVTTLK